MLGSIVHMPNRTAVLHKAYGLLRRGGSLYLSESCFRDRATYDEFSRRPGTKHVTEGIFGFADMVPLSTLAEAVETAGFSLNRPHRPHRALPPHDRRVGAPVEAARDRVELVAPGNRPSRWCGISRRPTPDGATPPALRADRAEIPNGPRRRHRVRRPDQVPDETGCGSRSPRKTCGSYRGRQCGAAPPGSGRSTSCRGKSCARATHPDRRSVVRFITFIEDHIPGYLTYFLEASRRPALTWRSRISVSTGVLPVSWSPGRMRGAARLGAHQVPGRGRHQRPDTLMRELAEEGAESCAAL